MTSMTEPGAIDCDVHPSVPDVAALLPHLDAFWRDSAVDRGLNSLDSNSYPLKSPLTSRPEWRNKNGLKKALFAVFDDGDRREDRREQKNQNDGSREKVFEIAH